MLKKIININNIFTFCLVITFTYGVWEAREYAFLAKLFPYYISWVLLVLSVIQLGIDIHQSVAGATGDKKINLADLSTNWGISDDIVWMRFSIYIFTIIALYAMIWIMGYPLSITMYILIFYRFMAKASWTGSCIAAAAGMAFLAVASRVLGMDWPQGLIVLPWPLG